MYDKMDFANFTEKLVVIFDETTVLQLKVNPNLNSLPDWDSLTALSLMAFFEEEFGIILEATDIQGVENIMDLYNLAINI